MNRAEGQLEKSHVKKKQLNMPFKKGNKLGKGRPKGTGKRQNISSAFQDFLDRRKGGRSRFEIAMERLFDEDLKTFLAYAYGKPAEALQPERPDGSLLSPKIVWVHSPIDQELITGPAPEKLLEAKKNEA